MSKLHTATERALVSHGVPTDLIERVAALGGDTISVLRALGQNRLIEKYGEEDGRALYKAVIRTPIADSVVAELLEKARHGCCRCRDGVSRPYQIHHIQPYSQTQDHSLENLAVVCPTCHAAIHRDDTPVDEQLEARDGWYALVRLSRAYEAEGVSFPFGAFEPLVFGNPVRARQLLRGREPSPSTCMALAHSELGRRCSKILQDKGRVVVFGEAGSGKSTLAVGAAGRAAGDGAVFRYRYERDSSSRVAVEEILHFQRLAEAGSTLVVDDMNNWATVAELEKVIEAATRCKVIAVWSESAPTAAPASPHMIDVGLQVSWPPMRADVLEFIAKHEPELTACVSASQPQGAWPKVGYGVLERPLLYLAEQHAKVARNVWHLTYLLGGGSYRVTEQLESLAGPDLDFAPLLQVAIRQIAGFEQPTSAAEAAEACAILRPGATDYSMTMWVESLFEGLHARRTLLRARHGFITVHREWARTFICAALADPGCYDIAARLVQEELDAGVREPLRAGRLLSWLRGNSQAERFLRTWAALQSEEVWGELIGAAIADGLATTSLVLANFYHFSHEVDGLGRKLANATHGNIAGVRSLFDSADAEDWHRLKELALALEHDQSLLTSVLSSTDPRRVAGRLQETPPYQISAATSYLTSANKARPDYCSDVRRAIDWAKVVAFVRSRLLPGDVRSVEELARLADQLGIPLRRSSLEQYGTCLEAALHGALPSNLDLMPVPTMAYMEYWPKFLTGAVKKLDAAAWASDLEVSDPQTWRGVAIVCGWTSRAGFSFSRLLADLVDPAALVANIRRKNPDTSALSLLMHTLSLASDGKRAVFGRAFAPLVEGFADEDAALSKALARFDLSSADGSTPSEGPLPVEPADQLFFRPLRERLPMAIQARADELEASGADFDVDAFFADLNDSGGG